MQDYVAQYPEELARSIMNTEIQVGALWKESRFQEAERVLSHLYGLMRFYEEQLPDGQRLHKGYPLHNWGIAVLLQKNPERIEEGFQKIFLAYIEDLLDFDTIQEVQSFPAYTALKGNPYVNRDLLELAQNRVEERKRSRRIPKNPEDVMTGELGIRAQGALRQFRTNKPKVVFVVHGRNTKARDAMYAFLRSIGLNPLTWDEAVLRTARASPYIGEILDTAFNLAQAVVVLLTPDDEGWLRKPFRKPDDPASETEPTPQARLNVIFEAGMAIGGRFHDRTVLVEMGRLRSFSDISGRLTVRLDNTIPSRNSLITHLRTAGCSITLLSNAWQSEGDFESATTSPRANVLKKLLRRFLVSS